MRSQTIVQLGTGIGVCALLLAGNGIRPTTSVPAWREASTSQIWSTASDVAEYAASTAWGVAESASNMLSSAPAAGAEDATTAALAGFRSLFSDDGAAVNEAPPAVVPDTQSPKGGAPCLITKWAAVWVVHADGSRSHVGFPTAGCELHAIPVEDLGKYPKAHGGKGAYFLDQQQSASACKLQECTAAARPTAQSQVGTQPQPSLQQAQTSAAQHPSIPIDGWGSGVAAGGAWMARTNLRFNSPARAVFPKLTIGAGEPLLLVFGGASVTDMLRNWVLHVKRTSMHFVVACMDEKLFSLAEEHGHPAVVMKESKGEESTVATRWKYYRMDPKAFLAMGILKVRFFMEFMRSGFDVLCSDLDVMWLGDPRPWIQGRMETSSFLALADVIVSTDVTAGSFDNDKSSWGINNEMNTGMVLLRSTPGAMVFCLKWKARMEVEMVKVSQMSSSFVQWWVNDQTFFNEVVHSARTMGEAERALKAHHASARQVAIDQLGKMVFGASQKKQLELAFAKVETLRARGADGDAAIGAIRGLIFKMLQCASPMQCLAGASYGTGRAGLQMPFTVATFPFLHFASGHTYFTQSLQDRLGFAPVSVHTTFQFGDTPEFTWGKRNRLREKLLWLVDDDTYYTRQGPGTDPNEVHYRGYLQLTGTLVELVAPLMRNEASSSIKIEGDGAYSQQMLGNTADVFGLSDGNPNKHLLLDAFQRRLVVNLVALGRAMRRKVIMPRMTCWCDRYWWLLEACRFPGVSVDQLPLPFHCPFDHLYDLEKWVHSDVPFREYSFLNNSRIHPRDRVDVVTLSVQGAPVSAPSPTSIRTYTAAAPTSGPSSNSSAASTGTRGAPPSRQLTASVGDSYAAVADALRTKGWSDAFVVQVDARSLELLCEDLGSPSENRHFNEIIHRVLGVAEQIRYCDRRANTFFDHKLTKPYDPMRNPINW